ncbi:MAG TPA: hypothetical protein VEC57_12630 [Candidatus Limnocylindrales bacterium]|nr:hypothetical protein [Candidatus Limnocylindrales bacterium]
MQGRGRSAARRSPRREIDRSPRAAVIATGQPLATRWHALWSAVDPGDASLIDRRLDSLRRIVLLYGAARSWLWLRFAPDLPEGGLALTALWMSICAALSFGSRRAGWAPVAALAALVPQLWWTFPRTNNHFYLELLVVVLLGVAAGRKGEDGRLAYRGVVWLTLIVLFHTGLQKVLYGYYFGAEMLAWMVASSERFGDLFAMLLPAEETARLRGYDTMRTGDGPYRVQSPLFIAGSNLVYGAEMALPLLLALPATRHLAAIASIALVVLFQLGAREIGFGVLFLQLLMLFLRGDAIGRTLPATAAFLAWAVAAAYGLLPGRSLVDPGYL